MGRLRALALVLLVGATCAVATGSAVSAAPSQADQAGQGGQAGQTGQSGSAAANGSASFSAASAIKFGANPPSAGAGNPKSLAADARAGAAGATTAAPRSGAPVQPSSGIGTGLATTAATRVDSADWLGEINLYRTAAGLGPVTDQPSWDSGIIAHLNYVARAAKTDIAGDYASLHTENPASAVYTSAGAREAGRSDLYFGATGLTPVAFIDGWLSAPFHAIGMLRARLTQVAFASTGGSAAGLDVIGGLDDSRTASTAPILFPGPGMTTHLSSYTGGESPDPLETCGWTGDGQGYGVPLIALLATTPSAGLSAQVQGPDGRVLSTGNGQLCLIDELSYRSTDSVYGPTGLQILRDDHAVLLIAHQRYAPGTYAATITQPGRDAIAWSFTTSASS